MGIVYLFALVAGFVSAGFVASLWGLLGRREASFGLLYPASFLLPLEVIVVVLATPLLLLKLGVAQIRAGRFVTLAWAAVAGAIFTGFFQGVALLSLLY